MGKAAWLIPVMVAISAFGGLSVHVMASSRMLYVGARNGHFPDLLAHLSISRFTPVASLIFLVNIIYSTTILINIKFNFTFRIYCR